MHEPHDAAVATILAEPPTSAATDPSTVATAARLRRELVADVLCGSPRPGRERARAVLEALASEMAHNGDDDVDDAAAAIVAASHAVAAGVPPGDAVAGAVAAFAVTWAQIAAALRRAGVPRWEIDVLLVRCGLTERQRRWAIDLR